MRILYGIQGTGHGHISRAREILPELSQHAGVDVLLSGTNCKMKLPYPDVDYRRGMSLAYDATGGVSYLKTAFELEPIRFLKDVQGLDASQYDLVISDYEPVSSWAAFRSGITCIGLSHQAAFLSDRTPRPVKNSIMAEQVLKHFAPCHRPIGFHFLRYDRFIEGPVIRSDVRRLNPARGGHVTVYLPAFDPETLQSIFAKHSAVQWEIFSPLCEETRNRGNVTLYPVGNEPFLKSMENSLGVLTSAGFETCAEAIYLKKKLMVVPIRNQYEQMCNAAALEKLGVSVSATMGDSFNRKLRHWLHHDQVVTLPEIADIQAITQKIVRFARRKSAVLN